ncbi:MAG TPA: ABC transporter permease [Actinomycetes bacterium]|nr:ABC transporter permease [Actinomycetes bacterium]
MLRFLIRRILFGLLVLWIIATAVFFLFYVASPGDPARLFAGRQATDETVAAVRRNLGLDRPLFVQYWDYLTGLLHWPPDLGTSFVNQEPVLETIIHRLPVSISIALGAAVLWLLIGIPIGILAATKPRSLADRSATVVALAGLSMPTFVLGMLLFNFFFYQLTKAGYPIFPANEYVPLQQDPIQWARHLFLAWLTLALVFAAAYSRLTRGSLLEVLGEDYIRTARAKGMPERTVIFRHGLRSALTPIVTLFGLDLGALLGGTIVTEKIFGLPGLGALAVQSVFSQDLPVIMGTVLVAAFFVVVANILVDMAYAVLDPRVRLT